MKLFYFFASALLLFSCAGESSPATSPATSETPQAPVVETEAPKPAPEILKSATYDQLVGMWELKEERSHPAEKGKEPSMLNRKTLFGFHSNGKFMSTSMGLDYLKDSWGDMGMKVIVRDGIIQSEKPSDIFEGQWGEGLKVFAVAENELTLQYQTMGIGDKDVFYWFKRVN